LKITTTHREAGVEDGDEPAVSRALHWYWQDDVFRPLGALATWRVEAHNARALDAMGDADLVMWWSMGGMSLSLLARAARRRPRPASLAVVHDGWPVYAPKFDRRTARYGRALPRALRYDVAHVDHWSFNSAHSRDLLGRAGIRLDAARCSVEHPGVDPARFAPVEPRRWKWRLAVVGRIEPRKGTATAIRALARLPEPATLTIAGPVEPRHAVELRALADRLGVVERVRWMGAVEDVAAVYAKADAVLFCVDWAEPFGLVPIEAMSVGRPVVATATGGAAEFIRDGENALVVTPGDDDATARAVMRLAQDPDLRERLRSGGAQTASAFTLQGFCDALADRAEAVAAPGGTKRGYRPRPWRRS
jgi:glycosyltransferase involved in cell wall biosynthesis